MQLNFQLNSLDDTSRLASKLAGHVPLPMMLALCGPLGAGKTQLVRSLAEQLGVAPETVTSPTYVLVQRYKGRIELLHLDFYRLKSTAEAWDLGLDEWLEEPVLTIVEWADKFPATWPENYVRCELSLDDSGIRRARLTAQGERGLAWLESVNLLGGTP